MARHLKTEPKEALMAAMLLFWREGYHTLGTRELEQQTGLTRFTLQKTYGGKKSFFLKALDAYLDMFETYLLPPILDGELSNLANWFIARPVPEEFEKHLCNGCLMINSITEFGRDDDDLNARSDRYYDMLRGGFTESLRRIRQNGQLAEHVTISEAAELLLASATALNVAFKANAKNANPKELGNATASLIRSWKA